MTSLKLANLWRVIRDVDLDAMRAAARAPFEIALVSEDPALGAKVAAAFRGGDQAGPAPWLITLDPASFIDRPAVPVLAVLLSQEPELSTPMQAADAHCARTSLPRATVVVGPFDKAALAPRNGERARAGLAEVSPAGVAQMAGALVALVSADERLALGAVVPVLRPAVHESIVEDTARANATFALTTGLAETVPILTAPLNLGDMIVLTKNQLVMGYRIMLASGRDGEPKTMVKEVLGVLGGGLLFRQAARQLIGMIPVVGLVPKVAIAYGGTWAMGRALSAWATSGSAVTAESVRGYSTEGLARGRAAAKQLLAQVRQVSPASSRSWRRLRGWLPLRGRRPDVPSAEE